MSGFGGEVVADADVVSAGEDDEVVFEELGLGEAVEVVRVGGVVGDGFFVEDFFDGGDVVGGGAGAVEEEGGGGSGDGAGGFGTGAGGGEEDSAEEEQRNAGLGGLHWVVRYGGFGGGARTGEMSGLPERNQPSVDHRRGAAVPQEFQPGAAEVGSE